MYNTQNRQSDSKTWYSLFLHLLKVRTRCLKMPIHVTTLYRCVYINTIKIAVNSVDFQLILFEQYSLPNVHVLSYKMWMAIVYMYNKKWQHVVIETIFSVLLWIPIICDAIQKKCNYTHWLFLEDLDHHSSGTISIESSVNWLVSALLTRFKTSFWLCTMFIEHCSDLFKCHIIHNQFYWNYKCWQSSYFVCVNCESNL